MAVCNCLVITVVISSFPPDWWGWAWDHLRFGNWWLDTVSWRKSVSALNWELMRRRKVWFFYVRAHFIVSIRRLRLIRADEWSRISKAKPRCFRAAENFPFRLHNTLTRVCLILAQRQDIITTPTARHRIADEIKLLTEEKCLALSLSLTLISPALCSREVYGYVSVQSESD